MADSDMSPKAKVSYDQSKFEVEFNVSEYTPEVSKVGNSEIIVVADILVWHVTISAVVKTSRSRA